MTTHELSNEEIADTLESIADLLEIQDANPHRVRAYRTGAQTVRNAAMPMVALVGDGDTKALEELPGIGRGLARIITEMVTTGRTAQLDRLSGEVSPEALFARVPGIGEELADRIVAELDIHTLEDLEQAAHDGRLGRVPGFGQRRVTGVRHALAGMLARSSLRRRQQRLAEGAAGVDRPPVSLILDVDAEYRRRAAEGTLRTIAPRRFNPEGEAWLPIMHIDRDGWSFTALYSNTALAHRLGTTDDWVVIYYERDGQEQQNTVVTESSGPLKGKRVVRGRETETRRHYAEHAASPST